MNIKLNNKLNKSIFTGLAAVALFAPMALHSAKASADNTNKPNPTTQVNNAAIKTIVNSDKVSSIRLKSQSNDTSKADLHDSDVNSIDHINLSDSATVSSPNMSDTNKLSNSLNTPAPHHNGSDLKSALITDGVQAVHFNGDKDGVGTDKIDGNTDYNLNNIDSITLNNKSTSVPKVNDIGSLNNVIRQIKNQTLKQLLQDEHIKAVHFNSDKNDVNTTDINDNSNYPLKGINSVTFDNAKTSSVVRDKDIKDEHKEAHVESTYIDASNVNDANSLKDAIDKAKSPAPAPKSHNGQSLKQALTDESIQTVHFNSDKNAVKTSDIKNDGDYPLKDINNVTFSDSNGSMPINASNINDIKGLNNTIDQINPDKQGKSDNQNKSDNQDSKAQESVKNSIDDFQNRISNDKSQIKDIQKQLGAKQDRLTDDQQQLIEFSSDQQDDESGQSNDDKEAVQNSIDTFKNRINDDKKQAEDVQNQLSAKQSQLNDDQQQLTEFGHSTNQNVDINGKAQPSNNNNNNDGNKNSNNNNSNNNNNVAPSSNSVVTPIAPAKHDNNDSNYQAPKMNDGSKEAGFPSAPAENHKPAAHKAKRSKKASAKQLRTAKARIKKARKQMNKIKKQLKKAKSHAKRAKISKRLKAAKKSVARAEVRFNHAKHNK